MKKLIVTSIMALGLAYGVSAAETQEILSSGAGGQPVRSEKFGTCVQTKWNAASNPCAPAEPKKVEAPAPVSAPAPAPQAVTRLAREQLTIYFDFNKYNITENSATKLDEIANAVKNSPRVTRVNIVGYTDQIGTNDYNEKLSQKRAEAVKAYLDTKISINVNVLGLRGLGEQNPVVDCSKTKKRVQKIKCMARDRRVEIEFEFQK